MKKIAVIPARYDASRFPAKLMGLLGNQTVILTTYRATQSTMLFDEVFVVTDSKIIFDEIVSNGGKAVMSKGNHETGTDRIAEAVEELEADIVLNVQGDEPFVQKEPLEKLLDVFEQDVNQEISVATLAQELTEESAIADPNNVKLNFDKDFNAMYFSRSPIPYLRETSFKPKYYEHIGVYAFRKDALQKFAKLPMLDNEKAEKVECIRFLEYGMKIKVVVTKYMGIEIDTPEDLVNANEYLKKLEQDK